MNTSKTFLSAKSNSSNVGMYCSENISRKDCMNEDLMQLEEDIKYLKSHNGSQSEIDKKEKKAFSLTSEIYGVQLAFEFQAESLKLKAERKMAK